MSDARICKVGHVLGDRSVRYIAAVASCGSIRAAARDLGVAPSAVQRTLVAAERQLGTASAPIAVPPPRMLALPSPLTRKSAETSTRCWSRHLRS
ncbi:hypothetical protein BH23ACT6_BH23ACT6_18910 [soil metagenome]